MIKSFEITEKESGERIDLLLTKRYPDISRSLIQTAIETHFVQANGTKIKPSQKLKMGDTITFNEEFFDRIAESIKISKEDIPISIIYEDADLLVIDKPAGLVVHPGSGNVSGTLVNALVNYDEEISEAIIANDKDSEVRPGIVHRLDKDTSGLLLVAKNKKSLSFLSTQIQKRQVRKNYTALVFGILPEEGILEDYIARDSNNRKIMAVVSEEKGKKAITIFKTLKYYSDKQSKKHFSLAEIEIPTGRTHQIRVQMKKFGFPIIGDQTYNTKLSIDASDQIGIKRQLLHASKIRYRLPSTNKYQESNSPLPGDFENVLKSLVPVDKIDHTK